MFESLSRTMLGSILVRIFTDAPSRRLSSRESKENQPQRYLKGPINLQGVGQEFVHLANLRRDAQINCAVADFHYQSSFDVRIDLDMGN